MESEEIKKEPTNGNQLKDFTIQLTHCLLPMQR